MAKQTNGGEWVIKTVITMISFKGKSTYKKTCWLECWPLLKKIKLNNTHSAKRDKAKTSLRVIGQAGRALLGSGWGVGERNRMDLQGEGTHQSLISCAL